MKVSKIRLIYFSPTGTTKKVLKAIAKGSGVQDIDHVDMTRKDAMTMPMDTFTDELVVIGAPVYAGRLPEDAVERLKRLKAGNTPAVVVVVYGNREFEDALLELADLSKDLGFVPVSGGAFIGEHSYATAEFPVAMDRPDEEDLEKAAAFGKATMEKMAGIEAIADLPPLSVPGNFPYKDGMPKMPASPDTLADLCTTCGTCESVCPTGAITINDAVETDPDLCIKCCACVKDCPTMARVMNNPFIKDVAKWLYENFSQRKEPELFV